MIRVLIVDDHYVVRSGLSAFLLSHDDMELVGMATNGEEALRLCTEHHPDVVLMDRAQHSSGSDLLDSVRKGDLPGIGMVIIDGIVRCGRSRNTPPAERVPEILH